MHILKDVSDSARDARSYLEKRMATKGTKDGSRLFGSELVTFQPSQREVLVSDRLCKVCFFQGTFALLACQLLTVTWCLYVAHAGLNLKILLSIPDSPKVGPQFLNNPYLNSQYIAVNWALVLKPVILALGGGGSIIRLSRSPSVTY